MELPPDSRLTFVRDAGRNSTYHPLGVYRCVCGTEITIRTYQATSGMTKSCGCLQREQSSRNGKANTRHGMSTSPEWRAWRNMRVRCANPCNASYQSYGGRGIRVCDRWQSFEAFLADMGPRPSPEYSLDRIDSNGNYEPTNCRWATQKEQQNNRRSNTWWTLKGETLNIGQWATKLGVNYTTLCNRVYMFGWSIEETLTAPVRAKRKAK